MEGKKNIYNNIVEVCIASIVAVLFSMQAFGQDPIFTQFYSSPMFLNPALAADFQDASVTLTNRAYTNQNFSPYRLTQFTGNYQFKLQPPLYGQRNKYDHNSGVSISAYQENLGAGALNTNMAILTAAHSIQVEKAHYLALGLQFGLGQKKTNGDLNWGSEYVPGVGHQEDIEGYLEGDGASKYYPTLGFGIMWFYNNSKLKQYMRKHNFDAFAGFSMNNLNMPNVSVTNNVTRQPIAYKINGGLKFAAHPQIHVFPHFIYIRQNGNNHLNLGTYTSIKPKSAIYSSKSQVSFVAGLWYKLNDAIVPLLGASMYNVKILLSYDLNVSKLKYKNRGRGATEITLKYTIEQKKKNYTRGLLYPSF